MKKYAAASVICLLLCLTGCDNNQPADKVAKAKKNDDLVFIADKNNSLGYYKSSLIKVNENLNVWLHMPKADRDSKEEMARLSEILVEISCNMHQIKILKTTDFEGKVISDASDEKWDTPSPASFFYSVIINICEEYKKAN